MKVGDLVREIFTCGEHRKPLWPVGDIIERHPEDGYGDALGSYWRILFGSELHYVREADLEVINAGR